MNETVKEVDQFVAQWDQYRKDGIVNEFRIKRFSTWANQTDKIGALAAQPLRFYPAKEAKRIPCRYLWESVVILQDGKVVPCCLDYEGKLILGDLNKESLEEIWHGDRLRTLRKEHMDGNFNNDLCRNCIEYPRATVSPMWPFNLAGLHSAFTWVKMLFKPKLESNEAPADITPP